MSRPPNYEFQEWWNNQRENHHDLFLHHKSQNPTWLIVDIQSPTADRIIHKDDQARTAHSHFHQFANFFAYLTKGFISLLRTANRRITAASGTSLMYRAIKAFLIVVVLLLMFEELVAAYFKRWYFSPPSAAAEVVDVYANWLEISEKYLAPALQSLTNVCVVLFLVQSLNRVLGCFWIKFRRVKPVAAVEDYPMVLVQIPRCNEREVAEAEDDPNTKRCKSTEANGSENGSVKTEEEMQGNATEAGDETKANPKPPEPPKDCIHGRARRGQATDSHSFAERVRREKISERMKLLQDLVPGCNKVTGKALMLDEIINYVQSLQRQVEFLSMKLASVNPRLDFNLDSLLPKDVLQPNGSMPTHPAYPLDSSASPFFRHQNQQAPHAQTNVSNGTVTKCSVDPSDTTLCRNFGMQLPLFDELCQGLPQFPTLCEDDLQSIVQMGFGQNPNCNTGFPSQSFPGSSQTSHMKIEL